LAVALGVATPDGFAAPTPDKLEAMRLAGEGVERALGRAEAEYLLVSLGGRDTSFFASLDPLMLKLASVARRTFTVSAAADYPCDCIPAWGCGGFAEICSQAYVCDVDAIWPRCGWWWNEDCSALCVLDS
jgi:hypothetical protein